MKIVAYSYSEPLLEAAPAPEIWGQEVDRIYQDLGGRQQLQQLLKDCQTEPVKYLLIQRFEELGDTVQQVCAHLAQLETLLTQHYGYTIDRTTLAGNPVVDEIGIRTYLGAPLIDRTGVAIGTICVVDLEPRPWGRTGLETIKSFAAELTAHLDRREAAQHSAR